MRLGYTVKSRFKVENLVTKMEFRIKKSRFNIKSRFKESKCADGDHSLNRDFTVLTEVRLSRYCGKSVTLSFLSEIPIVVK